MNDERVKWMSQGAPKQKVNIEQRTSHWRMDRRPSGKQMAIITNETELEIYTRQLTPSKKFEAMIKKWGQTYTTAISLFFCVISVAAAVRFI